MRQTALIPYGKYKILIFTLYCLDPRRYILKYTEVDRDLEYK
jgi:hypothetical protein